MDSRTGQVGVLAAGGVLVGLPVYQSLKDTGSLPTAHRLTVPLVVVGGCALIAAISPLMGVGLAWLAALALAMRPAPPKPAPKNSGTDRRQAAHVPGTVRRATP